MKVHFSDFSVSTRNRFELVDITRQVEAAVSASKIEDGLCLVYAPHATAAIIANEHEAGLLGDILAKLKGLFPEGAGYLHDRIDDNAHAHLASAFIASSRVFPVRGGRLVRGTWQNIMLVEADGPRTRRVLVEVLGE
ncbi:MAG: secondary thiamine-phosphate synthase enzyme YjbQ [Candidatus Hecatellaceae archaeon]